MPTNLFTMFFLLTLSGPCLDGKILGEESPIIIEVDGSIELNHILNVDGSFFMSQIIVWEWDDYLKTHVIRGYITDTTTYEKSKSDIDRELKELVNYYNDVLKIKPKLKTWPQHWLDSINRHKWVGRQTNRIKIHDNYCDLILTSNKVPFERMTIYRTKSFKETNVVKTDFGYNSGDFDVEVQNRDILPVEHRKGIHIIKNNILDRYYKIDEEQQFNFEK